MSRMACVCGHQIVDQTDDLPYKGEIIPDQAVEPVYYDGIVHDIGEFVEAVSKGERDKWMRNNLPRELADLNNESVISDIITAYLVRYGLTIYQCMECGRIYIQDGPDSNTFSRFTAEDWQTGSPSILASGRKR